MTVAAAAVAPTSGRGMPKNKDPKWVNWAQAMRIINSFVFDTKDGVKSGVEKYIVDNSVFPDLKSMVFIQANKQGQKDLLKWDLRECLVKGNSVMLMSKFGIVRFDSAPYSPEEVVRTELIAKGRKI